jgi:hypothetical protein
MFRSGVDDEKNKNQTSQRRGAETRRKNKSREKRLSAAILLSFAFLSVSASRR